jgi:cytochrome bd-type quinol oxidase subunit 2
MYSILLSVHSIIRYAVEIFLIGANLKALLGLIGKQPYGKLDDKLSLFLMISAHIQLLVGLILYFLSPNVQFSNAAMQNDLTRYWTVEHISLMIVAIFFITLARITSKRAKTDTGKHLRVFVFTLIAFLIVVFTLGMVDHVFN